MGTSSRRSAPSSGNWRNAKRHATGFVSMGTSSASYTPSSAMESYIQASGGGSSLIGGIGRGSGGSAVSQATGAAQAFGGFLSDVSNYGLDVALRNKGLQELIGKPPGEVIAGVLDALSGNGASLSDAILRAAEAETLGKIFDDEVENYDELQETWESSLNGQELLEILEEFLSNVIFKQWVSDMADNLENNAVSAESLYEKENEIKDFIRGQVSFELGRIDALEVDWEGEEGREFISTCLKSAIELMEE